METTQTVELRSVDSFTCDSINEHLEAALSRLARHDSLLFTHDANERSICFRLAFYLQLQFRDFHVACEYNRHHNDPRHIKRLHNPDLFRLARRKPKLAETDSLTVFPDIIVHRRETDQNLLVIETKKTTSNIPEDFDRAKLAAYRDEIHYRFAKFIRFGTRPGEQPIVRMSLSESTATPGLNFEVQHWLVANEALIGCFVSMSFSGSVV